MITARSLGLMMVVLLPLVQGCRTAGETARVADPSRSLVVITIDTLRADHLGCYGYFRDTSPHLDRLASEGTLLTRAITTMATTLPAHVSLWSSMYPVQTGVTTNGSKLAKRSRPEPRVQLFAEMLQELGYTTAAFVSATPVKRYTGIDAGFEVFDEPSKKGGRRGRGDFTTAAALEWLASAPERPWFLWIHYFDPHSPYAPPPPYDVHFSDSPELVQFLRQKRFPDPLDPRIHEIHNLYDGEILFVDSQIGKLIDTLKASGIYDDLTLVILSDHGEGLGQHERIGHGEIFNEQLFIPLIFKFPAASGKHEKIIDEVVSLVDVVPTLVDTLGLQLSRSQRSQFAGRNILASGRPRDFALAQRTTHKRRKWGSAEKFALVGREWKYTLETDYRDWLYDMRTDATEIFSVAHVKRDVANQLRDRLFSELAVFARTEPEFAVVEETSPEIVQELKALGYLD